MTGPESGPRRPMLTLNRVLCTKKSKISRIQDFHVFRVFNGAIVSRDTGDVTERAYLVELKALPCARVQGVLCPCERVSVSRFD